MKIKEFENKVFKIEGVRIVIRLPVLDIVENYGNKRMRDGKTTIAKFLEARVYSNLPADAEVSVVDGKGVIPPENTKLDTIRKSYSA